MNKEYDPRDYGPVPIWSWAGLKVDVERLDGKDAADLVDTFARSVDDRIKFAKYHYQEAVRLLADDLEKMDPADAFVYFFTRDAEARWIESNARAALTAFFQCLHPIEDHLGHAIYYGLNFDGTSPLKARDISLMAVKKKLTPWAVLKEMVDDMEKDLALKYVRDLVNHTKHRHIVKIEVSGSDDAAPGLMINAFTYTDGKGVSTSYVEEWALPKVREAFYAMQRHVMRIGLRLNWDVAART
ncbi:hypothetical protein QTH90_21125 [Variovorax sp. J2P1-59]|uniref:hypothetical protein n=1 Tax=Variovorax flavidus TaxID=3053501 RepID=UPI002575C2B6|nr:hypothetical protein [Variovorax sp. J2P1-59]MDM0076925.1 hypothetical protein [Variovorax sp. J2P1-59]